MVGGGGGLSPSQLQEVTSASCLVAPRIRRPLLSPQCSFCPGNHTRPTAALNPDKKMPGTAEVWTVSGGDVGSVRVRRCTTWVGVVSAKGFTLDFTRDSSTLRTDAFPPGRNWCRHKGSSCSHNYVQHRSSRGFNMYTTIQLDMSPMWLYRI